MKIVSVSFPKYFKVNCNSLGIHFWIEHELEIYFLSPVNNQLSQDHLINSSVISRSSVMLPLSHHKFLYTERLSLLRWSTSAPILLCLNYKALINVLVPGRTSVHLMLFQYQLGCFLALILPYEF